MGPDLSTELRKCRSWKMGGYGNRARFSAWTDGRSTGRWAVASVHVRLKQHETIEAMVWRGLAELNRRLLDGMPKPKPEVVARRKLRDARSASRFAN